VKSDTVSESPRLAARLDAVVEAGGVADRAGADLRHRATFGDRPGHAIAARRLVAGGTRGADVGHGRRLRLLGERGGGHRQGDDDGGGELHGAGHKLWGLHTQLLHPDALRSKVERIARKTTTR